MYVFVYVSDEYSRKGYNMVNTAHLCEGLHT